MTDPSDVPADMTGASSLDDRAADRLLRGRAVDGHPELASFVTGLTGLTTPPPEPRGELVALLAVGFDPTAAAAGSPVPAWPPARRRSWRRPTARVARLSVAAKVLLGSVVALAGMTSAAGAGVLPTPVQNGFAEVVRTMTPFELPTPEPQAPAGGTGGDDDGPAPRAPRGDAVVPRTQPEPTGQATTTQPTPTPTPTPLPSATPTPTPTPTPSGSPEPDPARSGQEGSPSPSDSATGAAAADEPAAAEPAEAAPKPRGNGEPKPSRSTGGGGRSTGPPVDR